jgi:hypothetical protein
MGTILHGREGIVYIGSSGGAAAINVGELTDWSIDVDYDTDQHLALGSSWAKTVRGGNRWSGSINGAFDIANKQLWQASLATAAPNMYIYPGGNALASTDGDSLYYYGTAFFKVGVAGGVGGKATVRVSFTGSGELGIGSA